MAGWVLFDLACHTESKETSIVTFWPEQLSLSKNSHFLYLLTTRWHCAETVQVHIGQGCHNTDQVGSEYGNILEIALCPRWQALL